MRYIILQVKEEYKKAFWYSKILIHIALQFSLILFLLAGFLYAVWYFGDGDYYTSLWNARHVVQAIPPCIFSLLFVAVIGDWQYRDKVSA